VKTATGYCAINTSGQVDARRETGLGIRAGARVSRTPTLYGGFAPASTGRAKAGEAGANGERERGEQQEQERLRREQQHRRLEEELERDRLRHSEVQRRLEPSSKQNAQPKVCSK
jgi:hypothetical protein